MISDKSSVLIIQIQCVCVLIYLEISWPHPILYHWFCPQVKLFFKKCTTYIDFRTYSYFAPSLKPCFCHYSLWKFYVNRICFKSAQTLYQTKNAEGSRCRRQNSVRICTFHSWSLGEDYDFLFFFSQSNQCWDLILCEETPLLYWANCLNREKKGQQL